LIDYWKNAGRDIRFLDIPPDVAEELGIELPPPLPETSMTTETETEVVNDTRAS
jgi:hypothetical protein